MKRKLNRKAEHLGRSMLAKRRRVKRWQKVMGVLGSIVVFFTTYALILPVITMEKTPLCGCEEHEHSESCYTKELICLLPTDGHVHSEECYTLEKVLSCQLQETEPHMHSEACLGNVDELICLLDECGPHSHGDGCYELRPVLTCTAVEHTHDELCYETQPVLICTEEHEHGETCYESRSVQICTMEEHTHGEGCYEQQSTLICSLEETEGHTHGPECYQQTQGLTCGLEETEGHRHDENCWTEEKRLTCGREAGEPHVHSETCYSDTLVLSCGMEPHAHHLSCYSDRNAGVEAPEDWEATLPALSGNPAKDMAEIARSQLEYRSITANYIVLDEEAGDLAYYNRYAAWYSKENEVEDENAAYRNWNSFFAAFCMRYAGVENDPEKFSAVADDWASNLAMAEKLSDPAEAAVGTGDLLFYVNEDGETLVSVVSETDGKEITAIVGDVVADGNRTVAEMRFATDFPGLRGFLDVEDTEETAVLAAAVEMPVLTAAAPAEDDPRSSLPVVGYIVEKEEAPVLLMKTAGRKMMLFGASPLPAPGNIDIATVSSAEMYWKPADQDPTVNSGWTKLDSSSSPLQGNEHIKLMVDFSSLRPKDLKGNDYKMHFTLPDGLERCETSGTILIGTRLVGTLSSEADHKHITIAFDPAWVDSLDENSPQQGNFFVTAELDQKALDGDNDPTITVGNIPIHFPANTTDLLARHGQVSLTKALAGKAFKGEDGKYYLTYTLTVKAGEHGAQAITVRDIFADASNIAAFNGISTTEATANGNGIAAPKDERISGEAAADAVCPGTVNRQTLPTVEDPAVSKEFMVWDLGNMGPSEVRTLTYTVQLSDKYTSTYHGTDESLDNTAQVFSKTHPRNTDNAHYVSENNVNVSKSIVGDVEKTENGTYKISYQLEVSAPSSNEFPVKNVTVDDSFLNTAGNIDEWVRYDEGSFKLDGVAIPSGQIRFDNNGTGGQRRDGRASFSNLPVGDLEPGQTKVITYDAELAEEAFAQTSGAVRVDNTAKAYDASAPDRKETSQSRAWTDVRGEQWSRKFVGETLTGSRTEEMNGDSFDLERGALKYEVIVNESGNWNMNNMMIVDASVSNMLKIVGNVRVDAYLVDNNNRPEAGADNAAALAKLTSGRLAETKWIMGTDGTTGFTQTISELGFDAGKNYAYVLTYYAVPDPSEMKISTSAMISVGNNLTLSGSLIGKGGKVIPVNTTVTSTSTVSNPNIFKVKKTAWYYEKPGEGISGYINGALYWVVRVDGNQIMHGLKIQDSSNLGEYKNYNHDGKDGSAPAFVGAFVGSLGADENGNLYELRDVYPDAASVLNSVGDGRLRGLDYEIVEGENQGTTAPVEIWYGGNLTNDGSIKPARNGGGVEIDGKVYYNHDVNFKFRTDYAITPGESIYIVFRTEPMTVPTKGSDTFTYKNKVNYNNGTGWVDLKNEAPTQTLYGSDGIQKSVKRPAFLTNTNNTSWYNNGVIGNGYGMQTNLVQDHLRSHNMTDGYITDWNIRLNTQGKLSGAYRVLERLPEGTDLVSVLLAGIGKSVTDGQITFNRITDLSSEWKEYTCPQSMNIGAHWGNYDGRETGNGKPTIYYYINSSTNEVLLEINGLKNGSDQWADLQFLTHIIDPLTLQGQETDFVNDVSLLNTNMTLVNRTTADATVKLPSRISKEAVAAGPSGYQSAILPYSIIINDQTIDLNPNGTTVNLIDEMSEFLIIEPSSVRIYKEKLNTDPWTDKTQPDPKAEKLLPKYNAASTADYKGYTVVITNNGHTMKLENLPDNQVLSVFYDTTVNTSPGVDAIVTNVAHWEGVPTQDESGSSTEVFKYTSSGSVDASPILSVRKVDPADAQGSILAGATFELKAVLYFDAAKNQYIAPSQSPNFQGPLAVNLNTMTGTTQSGQLLMFGKDTGESAAEPHLVYHTVYELKETTAPDGYVLDSTPYYFIIAKETGRDASGNNDYPNYLEYLSNTELRDQNVYVSYGGPDYTYTAYNHRGEIEVSKKFGGNAEGGRPVEGTYYFALYDFAQNGSPLGEARYTASITYSAADIAAYDSAMLSGATYVYKTAIFQDLPLNVPYYLFETDAAGTPIPEGGMLNINGESFVVNYTFPKLSDGSENPNHQLIPNNDNQGFLQVIGTNNRYQATVTKSFADVAGSTLSQGLVGTYDFGIWKADASGNFDFQQPPLEKQSVVFRIQDSNLSEKSAVFKGLTPGNYVIYELDGNGKPLFDNTHFLHSSSGAPGNDFIVRYSSETEFTINGDDAVEHDVHAVNTSSVSLPMTGGIGTKPYQLGGALLVSASLLAGFGLRRRKRKEDNT